MEFAGLTAGHPCPFGVLNALIIHSDFHHQSVASIS